MIELNQPIRWNKIRNTVIIGSSPMVLAVIFTGIGVYLSSDCVKNEAFCKWAATVLD